MRWMALLALTCCAVGCEKKNPQPKQAPAKQKQTATKTAAQQAAKEKPTEEEAKEAESTRPEGPSVTAYDFMNNRHLAHVWNGALLIDVGTPSAVKYVDGDDWYEGFSVEDALVANPKGDSAEFLVPLGGPGADGKTEKYQFAVRLRPLGKQRATLSIRGVGGQKVEIARLDDLGTGWGTHSVLLPDGLPLGREYRLVIDFSNTRAIPNGGRSAAEIDWVAVGPDTSKFVRRDEFFDTLGNRIRLPDEAAVWWNTILPKHGELVAGADGLVDIKLRVDKTKPVTIEQTGGKFKEDLGKYAHQPIVIAFSARRPASITRPRVDVPGAEATGREGAPEHVLIWNASGVRADHLKAYVPATDVETPNLDEFANYAAVFRRAISQSGRPVPSVASVFTMSYPAKYDLLAKSKVPYEATLLPEPFESTNWRTGLFSAADDVSKKSGFDRGFGKVVVPPKRRKKGYQGPDTEFLWPKAEEWLVNARPPLMMFVHSVDATLPFDPASTLVSKYAKGTAPSGLVPAETDELTGDDLDDAKKKYLQALYKAEITHNDLWFGTALEMLDSRGIRDKTMIVYMSDHGSKLGEYGELGATDSVTRESVWVPLMIQYTPWTGDGVTVEETVELVDLYRTLLDGANVGRVNAVNFQGRSLAEDMLDPTPRMPRPAFSYSEHRVGLQIRDWKYSRSDEEDELYRFEDDSAAPYESMNRAGHYPIAHRMMRDAVGFQLRYDEKWDKSDWGYVNNHTEGAARKLDKSAW